MFKHILQYLRAVRDQQPFACAESLTRDQLAAIAAEAHFYGLADLERATVERNNKGEYEYKYLAIDGNGLPSEYNPKMTVRWISPNYVKDMSAWEPVGLSSEKMASGAPLGGRDLSADPGNLLHLHSEGWEHVHSFMTALPNFSTTFTVVLRRRL